MMNELLTEQNETFTDQSLMLPQDFKDYQKTNVMFKRKIAYQPFVGR